MDARSALDTMRGLAGIGQRESTSTGYRRAADLVERRLRDLGFRVRRQQFSVPSGTSWGVQVPAGSTVNVVAEPEGLDKSEPYVVVGAHLDTVPRSPGANDNASGVAAMLEVARLTTRTRPRLPVVFVAFAGEERRRPIGAGSYGAHYGSIAYVAAMPARERKALAGMISLDAVGVGGAVRVCTSGARQSKPLRDGLRRTGAELGIPTNACTRTGSDHFSFEQAGMPAVLITGGPYDQYHTPSDRVDVVQPAALARAIELTWTHLT